MTTDIKDNGTGQIWRMLRASRLALFICLTLLAGLAAALPATSLMAEELDKRFAAYDQTSKMRIDHSAWDRLLKAHVTTDRDGLNRFDYAGLKASGLGDLRKYLAQLQSVNPAKLSRDEQFAFWTNLYNAKTMEIVADKYPVNSIRKIRLSLSLYPGPWREKVMKVMGVELSLDDIEHKILRPIWRDPRIHYAVNCASVGCPNLQDQAYTGSALETMLEKAARDYINSPRGVRFEGTKVIVSSLYDWYGPDFGGSVPNILAHIRKYAGPALSGRIAGVKQFSDYEYDWALNERK
jgi:hypothetical protein